MKLKNTKTIVDEDTTIRISPVNFGARRVRVDTQIDVFEITPYSAVRLGIALILLGLPQLVKRKLAL